MRVKALTPAGLLDVRADLVIGADGRHSTVRRLAALVSEDLGAPIDVLWFRLPRRPEDHAQTGGYIRPGAFFVLIESYANAYFAQREESDDHHRVKLHLAEEVSFLNNEHRAFTAAVDALGADAVKLLTVQVDRLRQWCKPGLLCISDAAHAMSPVGGVGINLAIRMRSRRRTSSRRRCAMVPPASRCSRRCSGGASGRCA